MSGNFWSDWEKPWTKEQCRMRYVQGSEIGLRQLSKDAGCSRKTLGDWCKQGEWVTERRRYGDRIVTATREKAIAKTSDKLSDEISDIATEHFAVAKLYRAISELLAKNAISKVAKARKENAISAEKAIEQLERNIPRLNLANLMLDRSIKIERAALGLDYNDAPIAIAFLEKLGFQVNDPSVTQQNNTDTTTEKKTVASKGLTDEQANAIRANILGVSSDASDSVTLPSEVDSGQLQSEDSGQESADRD